MAGGGGWRWRNRPPRSCEDYWWEWRHCRGLRHAFHHYYAHGARAAAAQEALCKSERARVEEKQKYAPVWTFRKSPPPDWYLPLDQDSPK
uniref:Synaptic plasticity regulator PANTS n=1 Tax=Cairina moschata TaxID=8855 RepID=A0A8C3CHC8_CAIMO